MSKESHWLVESDVGGYMYTEPGVAFLICRKGRVVTLQAKALLEAVRAAKAAKIGWYRVEVYSPPLVIYILGTEIFVFRLANKHHLLQNGNFAQPTRKFRRK